VNYASRRDRRKGGFADLYFDDDDENGEVDYTKQYYRREDTLFVS